MKKSILLLVLLCATLLLMTACSNSDTPKDVALDKVMKEIETSITLPESMTDLTAGDLTRLYGIESAQYVQFAGKVTNIGILGDEIVIVEASSAAAATEIKQQMEKRYQSKLNEMDNYLPDEHAKITAGRVVQNGNFVAMLINAEQATLDKLYDDAVK